MFLKQRADRAVRRGSFVSSPSPNGTLSISQLSDRELEGVSAHRPGLRHQGNCQNAQRQYQDGADLLHAHQGQAPIQVRGLGIAALEAIPLERNVSGSALETSCVIQRR